MIKKLVASSLLVGLAFGLVITVVFGVCFKSYDTHDEFWVSIYPLISARIKTASVYGFPLAWNTAVYEPITFHFREPNIRYFLLDTVLWGAIGGVPLAFWVVRKEDMKLKWKIAKFAFLASSIPLLVFSPLFIFYHGEADYPYTSTPPSYFWEHDIYYILFGVFLLMAGLVLIIASYYERRETNSPITI